MLIDCQARKTTDPGRRLATPWRAVRATHSAGPGRRPTPRRTQRTRQPWSAQCVTLMLPMKEATRGVPSPPVVIAWESLTAQPGEGRAATSFVGAVGDAELAERVAVVADGGEAVTPDRDRGVPRRAGGQRAEGPAGAVVVLPAARHLQPARAVTIADEPEPVRSPGDRGVVAHVPAVDLAERVAATGRVLAVRHPQGRVLRLVADQAEAVRARGDRDGGAPGRIDGAEGGGRAGRVAAARHLQAGVRDIGDQPTTVGPTVIAVSPTVPAVSSSRNDPWCKQRWRNGAP